MLRYSTYAVRFFVRVCVNMYSLLCSCSSSTFPRTMAGTPKAEANTHTQIFTTWGQDRMKVNHLKRWTGYSIRSIISFMSTDLHQGFVLVQWVDLVHILLVDSRPIHLLNASQTTMAAPIRNAVHMPRLSSPLAPCKFWPQTLFGTQHTVWRC